MLSTGTIVPEVRVGKENGSWKGNYVTMSTDTHFKLVVLRVVTLVGGYESSIFRNCIKQPERQLPSSSYNHNTLTVLRTLSACIKYGSLLQL